MTTMVSQITSSRLFAQSFIQAQIKENIKALRHWPLCGEFTGTGEFPAQRASNAENVSIWWRHHDQVLSREWNAGVLCDIGYPSETHLKLKSGKISFVHSSDTAVLCAKLQDDWIIQTKIMDEQDFAWFEFRTDILYCTAPLADHTMQYSVKMLRTETSKHPHRCEISLDSNSHFVLCHWFIKVSRNHW